MRETDIRERIHSGNWDYVVLQFPFAADEIATFVQYAGQLMDTIISVGAIPVIFDCWPVNWNPQAAEFTRQAMAMAKSKGALLMPVNAAFRAVRGLQPDISLYLDWIHAAPAGGYLASLVCYTTLTGQSPLRLSNLYSLDSGVLGFLQIKAWEIAMADSVSMLRPAWSDTAPQPAAIKILLDSDSIPQFLRKRVSVATRYSNGIIDTSFYAVFSSSNPESLIAVYSTLTAQSPCNSFISAELMGKRDSMQVRVVPSRAVLDSIVLSPLSFTIDLPAQDGDKLVATGYFHENGENYTLNMNSSVSWITDTALLKIRNGVIQQVTAQGVRVVVIASLKGIFDTLEFNFAPSLRFVRRINFQTDTVPFAEGWLADNGRAYDSVHGYGFLNTSYLTSRNDRKGVFLLKTFVSASVEKEYKILSHDGDYILKIAMGDNIYGGAGSYVRFGNDTLIKTTGATNIIKIDTIRVFGEAGIHLFIKGPINYMVVISSQDVDINSVARDNLSPTGSDDKCGIEPQPNKLGLNVYPNPFNPSATISYRFPGSSGGNYALYNAQGIQIRRYMIPHGVNSGQILWDGCDDFGKPVAAGWFIGRLETANGEIITQKLMLLR
ncbi:MAG: hypothetical protein JNL74_00385 [Fibrobacteres bacterium]|nr:hypothetical protein [Fibrobacterota bacterium]